MNAVSWFLKYSLVLFFFRVNFTFFSCFFMNNVQSLNFESKCEYWVMRTIWAIQVMCGFYILNYSIPSKSCLNNIITNQNVFNISNCTRNRIFSRNGMTSWYYISSLRVPDGLWLRIWNQFTACWLKYSGSWRIFILVRNLLCGHDA